MTSALSAPLSWAKTISGAGPEFGFPKSRRILRRKDFRKVYDEGTRSSCPLFAAFSLRIAEQTDGPRVGFTVPRAIGKAVIRNRIRRRMREAVRLNLGLLPSPWSVVFNPRRTVLSAEFESLQAAVRKVFQTCANS